ncbi:MAG: phosphoadenosine phosphosulfate reductase family protein [Lachnospiraceae bacterium]|nr:phosphoadenosine phosphosulfate reductase family protein [Lachnospiraceae bacterium]
MIPWEKVKDKKVIMQLSGGKDSVACLVLLKENGIDVSAIHFVHHWGYTTPTRMAEEICRKYEVDLKIVDISMEIKKLFLDSYKERPCRNCKAIMDQKTVEFAMERSADYICVGDSGSDRMLINRLKERYGNIEDDLYRNQYFNEKVMLPNHMLIFRPLIEMNNEDVFSFLESRSVSVKRVNDTGDKYFEYSREGCPLQFKDFGVFYTEKLMDDLFLANKLCSEFATAKEIRASIHLPSEFIVTIPAGYEEECHNYLEKKGFEWKKHSKKTKALFHNYMWVVQVYSALLEDSDMLSKAIRRICERLEIKMNYCNMTLPFVNISFGKEGNMSIIVDAEDEMLSFMLYSRRSYDLQLIKNILIEVFHTKNYCVYG